MKTLVETFCCVRKWHNLLSVKAESSNEGEIMDYKEPPTEMPKLTRFQRLELWARGYVYIGQFQERGWAGPLPYYVAKCSKCGLQIMRIRGRGWLACPVCMHPHVYFVGLKYYNV